jgi:hypothetical protein
VVDVREWTGRLVFNDVGAIVHYLRAVPWLVPGFSVTTYMSQLRGLQARVDAGEELSPSLCERTSSKPGGRSRRRLCFAARPSCRASGMCGPGSLSGRSPEKSRLTAARFPRPHRTGRDGYGHRSPVFDIRAVGGVNARHQLGQPNLSGVTFASTSQSQ